MPAAVPPESCKWCGAVETVLFGVCLWCEKKIARDQGLRNGPGSPKVLGKKLSTNSAMLRRRRQRAWN